MGEEGVRRAAESNTRWLRGLKGAAVEREVMKTRRTRELGGGGLLETEMICLLDTVLNLTAVMCPIRLPIRALRTPWRAAISFTDRLSLMMAESAALGDLVYKASRGEGE